MKENINIFEWTELKNLPSFLTQPFVIFPFYETKFIYRSDIMQSIDKLLKYLASFVSDSSDEEREICEAMKKEFPKNNTNLLGILDASFYELESISIYSGNFKEIVSSIRLPYVSKLDCLHKIYSSLPEEEKEEIKHLL